MVCSECKKGFSSEHFVKTHLESNAIRVEGVEEFSPSGKGCEVVDMAISEYGSGGRKIETICDQKRHDFLVNARTNHHYSAHALTSCFKKGVEFRFKKPDLPNAQTTVSFQEDVVDWFSWSGTKSVRNLFEVELKRSPFDVFMNNYSPVVSNTFKCNSNVGVGVDGPAMIYCTSHASKSTQKEDSEPYLKVVRAVVRCVNKQQEVSEESSEECEELLSKEGLRRVIGATMAKSCTHVVSAPLAWYLISKHSRFRFSHEFQHCNLHNFEDIAEGKPVKCFLTGQNKEKMVLTHTAVEYLNRPDDLEDLSVYQYLENYKAMNFTRSDKFNESLVCFKPVNDGIGKGICENQGLLKLSHEAVPMIGQSVFEDTSNFKANILDPLQTANHALKHSHELQAKRILILFVPFRDFDELKLNGSHVSKLQSIKLPEEVKEVLQNMQDCTNSLRLKRQNDRLERCTFRPRDDNANDDDGEPDEEELDTISELFETLDKEDNDDSETSGNDGEMCSFSSIQFSQAGESLKSEFVKTVKVNKTGSLLKYRGNSQSDEDSAQERFAKQRQRVTQDQLTSLAVTSLMSRVLVQDAVQREEVKATGSPLSTVHCGMSKNLDEQQQRAFEVLVAKFVLSFYEDALVPRSTHPSLVPPSKRQ